MNKSKKYSHGSSVYQKHGIRVKTHGIKRQSFIRVQDKNLIQVFPRRDKFSKIKQIQTGRRSIYRDLYHGSKDKRNIKLSHEMMLDQIDHLTPMAEALIEYLRNNKVLIPNLLEVVKYLKIKYDKNPSLDLIVFPDDQDLLIEYKIAVDSLDEKMELEEIIIQDLLDQYPDFDLDLFFVSGYYR